MADFFPPGNRRDFLTGAAARKECDANSEHNLEPPVAGDTVRLETRAMGCAWNIILNPGPAEQVAAASAAFAVVHRLEQQLTIYRPDSDLNVLNRSALFESPVVVSDSLFLLLKQCSHLHQATEGAFDPATRPLTELWRACRQSGRVPAAEEISRCLTWCGIQHVNLDDVTQSVTFRLRGLGAPPLEIGIDLGGIGKGAGIDAAVAELQASECQDFLIHGGYSSLRGNGVHGGHIGWPVGLKNPLFHERRLATLLLCDEGMSSSGSNVQFFRHDGRRYGHILDPRTGWPSDNLLSVTVVARTAALADALSTAFYVMGLDKASAYCDDHPDVGAILVPFPKGNRTLSPVVRNIPADRLFFEV